MDIDGGFDLCKFLDQSVTKIVGGGLSGILVGTTNMM